MKYLELKEQLLNEINMSPGSLRRTAAEIGARAGMEFEMIVPGANQGDDDYDDDYREVDYDADESINSIQDAFDFFYDGDFNSRRDCERLRDKMNEDYLEWLSEQEGDRWETDKEEMIYDWLRYNAAPSDVFGILGVEEDENGNYPDPSKEDYRNAAAKVSEDQINPWYEEAEEDFRDNFYGSADMESEWLQYEGIETMQDVETRYSMTWPHYFTPERETGGVSIEDAADSFSRAIGREVEASGNYHSRSVERPSATKLHYVVEPDGSLEADDDEDGGLEFVSPALPIDELLDDLKKVKAWADKTGCYTNDSTGLHINVSVPAWQGDLSKLDYVKLAVLMGDEYVLKEFGRQGNTYAKSALKIVKDNIRQRPEDVKRLLDTMKEHLNTSAAKLVHSGSTNKYTSVNTKDGYIEFRSPGGDWLNENFDKIESTLLRFVVAMDAAVDETKYKEEYAKKLYKLLAGDQKDATNTMVYFAKYAAGELPQSALKSFIKQAQFERSQGKEPDGKKMWYRVDKEGRGRSGASIEVVASSKEEALEKAASNWSVRLSSLTAADAYPIRAYEETKQRYEIYNKQTGNAVEDAPSRVANDAQALEHLQDYISMGPHGLQRGQATNMFGIRKAGGAPVEPNLSAPIPGSTLDLQRQRNDAQQGRAQTSETGQWKIVDGLNREVFRFSSADNTRAKANELAALWARENNFDGNYQVEPVGHNDPESQSIRPRTPQQGGNFTGIWKLVDGTGRELYRLSGVGNNADDAYRAAVPWIRNNGHDRTEGLRMVPVMDNE